MENTLISTANLLNRPLYPGMEFKSKETTHRFISINNHTATILYFDRQEEIPIELFYKVLIEDNKEMLNNYSNL